MSDSPRRFGPLGLRDREQRMIALTAQKDELRRLAEEGLTLQEIGDRFGVTRERVRQVLDEMGVNRDRRRAYEQRRAEEERERVEAAADDIMRRWRQVEPVAAIADDLGLNRTSVFALVRERATEIERRRRARAKNKPPKTNEDELLARLREGAIALGETLTSARFSDWARERGYRGHQTYLNRFGSWRAALAAADIEMKHRKALLTQAQADEIRARYTGAYREQAALAHEYGVSQPTINAIIHGRVYRSERRRRRDRIPTRKIRADIASLIAELGRLPTADEYERLARSRGFASLATVRTHFGNSWVAALEAASQPPPGVLLGDDE